MNIEEHSRRRQIELGKSIAQRRKVYVDMCFWIRMRDAVLDPDGSPEYKRLFSLLRQGVRDQSIICPISSAIFLELMKQQHCPERRIGTAKIIDDLSEAICIIPSRTIVGTEINIFLSRYAGAENLHPIQELIWTKVAYVLGDLYPFIPGLKQEELLAVQIGYFDHLWASTIGEMVECIGDANLPAGRFIKLSNETNENNSIYKDELTSYTRAYDIELRGMIEVMASVAADIIESKATNLSTPTAQERAQTIKSCGNLLYQALQKPEVKCILRMIHIGVSIHAGMRWDKARKFKPNDYYDFEHAAFALAYCDVFLTEGPLHHLVTREHLNLHKINNCSVISDIEEVVDFFEKNIVMSRTD